MLESLLLSLGLTLLFEISLALLLGLRKRKDFLLVALVNTVTNPPLVLILNLLQRQDPRLITVPIILLLELGAVTVEWLLYRRGLEYRKLPPLVLSLILNTLSYLGGLLI